MSADWTDQRVEQLKALWTDGLSAAQIAAEMNQGGSFFSRSAIIGKVHRLNLSGRAKTAPSPQRVRKPRSRRPFVNRPKPNHQDAPVPESLDEPQIAVEAAAGERRLALIDLTDDQCKWPFGDPQSPDFYFCGADTLIKPYCSYHARVAYTPGTARRPK